MKNGLEFEVLRQVDFDWTVHLDSVWEETEYHVPQLHQALRAEVIGDLERTNGHAHSPLGRVVVGPAGAGKTHLLGALRREITERGYWFVLVDMTDVRDSWDTIALGYLHSLLRPMPTGQLQHQAVLAGLLGLAPDTLPALARLDPRHTLRALSYADARLLAAFTERLLTRLHQRLRPPVAQELLRQQDVVRALLLLASQDVVLAEQGYCWLQGLAIEDEIRRRHHFRAARRTPFEVIRGLSWVMAQSAPTLLAIDQMDAFVSQHHLASSGEGSVPQTSEARTSLAIIEGLSGGLMTLRDLTRRTLTLVVCLESTWAIIRQRTLQSSTDRFLPPDTLKAVGREQLAQELVVRRLAPVYRAAGFAPPYPTWPFQPAALAAATPTTPRHLLKLCDSHRRACLGAGKVIEAHSFQEGVVGVMLAGESQFAGLDRRFQALCSEANLLAILTEQEEDHTLCALLQTACRCFLEESDSDAPVDAIVDGDFRGARGTPPLHARIRWIEHAHGDRERHFCIRGLQRTNATAYQNRLKAAVTAAGIDRNLGFRRLVLVRRGPVPSGPISQRLTEELQMRGGQFVEPTNEDLQIFWALHILESEQLPDFRAWLRHRRPVSNSSLAQASGLARMVPGHHLQLSPDKQPEPQTIQRP